LHNYDIEQGLEVYFNGVEGACIAKQVSPLFSDQLKTLNGELLAQGQTQGSTLQQRTNKTLTTGPFGNTCEADEVSPEVEAGMVAGIRCLQP
jgi:hypothetical protein